jgi:hypothetical protein
MKGSLPFFTAALRAGFRIERCSPSSKEARWPKTDRATHSVCEPYKCRSNPSVLSYSKGCEPLARFELTLGMQEAAHAVACRLDKARLSLGGQLRMASVKSDLRQIELQREPDATICIPMKRTGICSFHQYGIRARRTCSVINCRKRRR